MGSTPRNADRGPARRSRIAGWISGRRARVRALVVVMLFGGGVTVAAVAPIPRRQLLAPVLDPVAVRNTPPPYLDLEISIPAPELVEIPSEPLFQPADPFEVGLDPGRLALAVGDVRREVRRGAMPGAALVVGRGSRVVEKVGIGVLAPGLGRVDPDNTLYDLASLTKVIATTTAVMLLVEDGLMELDAPVSRYLPEFTGGSKSRVTVRHLLTHTSGLPAGISLGNVSPEAALRRIIATPLKWKPGERMVYSDLGPIILFAAAERVAGEPLEELLQRRVFGPLGMRNTMFRPSLPCETCAPTTSEFRGVVHDPIARRLGGVAGNAGLFSTATDVARFAAMLANGGELEGVRVLREETIHEFTARQPRAGTRALGWDTPDPDGNGGAGSRISQKAFGHTGFTGTSLWIDPERGTWAVLLANRTYVRAPNRMQALRRTVNDRLAEAVDLASAD